MIDKKYIPLDKSWIIRMGVLDMVNGYDDIQKFLSKQDNLSDDLLALKRAVEAWKSDELIDVGESGTLYRLLKFASWKLGLNKKFITHGTLSERKITDDPSIVNLPQERLLELDNGTSQWATAAVLLGDGERLSSPPFKLALTYEAIDDWKQKRSKGLMWEPRYDETILNQSQTYLELLRGNKPKFVAKQAEDFCFAYTFGYMTAEEGEKRWPALRGHESDRVLEIQEMLSVAKEGREVSSKDHRVIQAIAMWGKVNNKPINILYPESVNKSWPQFWDFLASAQLI
ncbi:MAG: hypothetical protein WAX80_02970 [Minisyncoccia bacterium]